MVTARIPSHVPVLIVGAGPTGLTAGAVLHDLGVRTLVIDRADGPSEQSKALAVQARTLELFERLGIADQAVQRGQPIGWLRLIRDGRQVASLPLSTIGRGLTAYPYVLSLEQSVTEALMTTALHGRGGQIRWRHQLTALAPDAAGATARIHAEGREHVVRADWVVGADGASSIVRKASGQAFEGGTYEQTFLLADLQLDSDLPRDGVAIDLRNAGVVALFPLPGDDRRHRVIATVPSGVDPDTLDDVGSARLIAALASYPIAPEPLAWTSVYRLHHRRAGDFRRGRLLLAGDAAHVHSPVGGQGMNTGIGDAYNLAWKLARVVRGVARDRLMDTYAAEREPFAEALLSTTDQAFELLAGAGIVRRLVRRRAIPPLLAMAQHLPAAQRMAFRLVSQLAIEYRDSVLSIKADAHGRVRPGDRAPDTWLTDGGRLFTHLQQVRHHLLVLPGPDAPDESDLSSALQCLADDVGWVTPGHDLALARSYGLPTGGVVLIRPDGHVAVAAAGAEAASAIARYALVVSGAIGGTHPRSAR